jgi:hypothetical protein
MKKLNVCAVLSIFAFCTLLISEKSFADTATLTLVSTGGQSSGPDYVYPYYFSIDGSTTLTPLMCISYSDDIYFGESWTATIVPVSGNEQYVEAAYIESMAAAPGASATTIAEAQWANWELFDPKDSNLTNNLPAGYQPAINTILGEASQFAENNINTTAYSNLEVFIPIDGTESTGGDPQALIGDSPTPEPRSLVLFASGLLALAGIVYLRKRSDGGVAVQLKSDTAGGAV